MYLPIDYYVFTIGGKHCRKPRSGWKNAENPALALSSCHHVIESVIIFNSIKLEMLGRVAKYLRLDCILVCSLNNANENTIYPEKNVVKSGRNNRIYRTDLMDSGWLLFAKGNKRQVWRNAWKILKAPVKIYFQPYGPTVSYPYVPLPEISRILEAAS